VIQMKAIAKSSQLIAFLKVQVLHLMNNYCLL